MSFSRRMGASPSTKRRVRCPVLVIRQSPMTSRSPGLSSILSAISIPGGLLLEHQPDSRMLATAPEHAFRPLRPFLNERQQIGAFVAHVERLWGELTAVPIETSALLKLF